MASYEYKLVGMHSENMSMFLHEWQTVNGTSMRKMQTNIVKSFKVISKLYEWRGSGIFLIER